jgi:hypothetical protein
MMDLDEFDSLDYDAIFGARAKATGKGYGNREDREARLRAERRAGLSPKQRQRIGAPPKKIVNFRATDEMRADLKALAKHFGVDQTAVILRAIEQLVASVPGIKERK